MRKKQIEQASSVLKSDPVDPPILFPHRVIDLQLLNNILSNYSFLKANADKLAAEYIRKFDRVLELKKFTAQERTQFITIESNQLVESIVLNDSRLELSTFLDKEIRDTKLKTEIARLEKLSDEEYYQQILTDSENSGKGFFPPQVDANTSKGAYVGLNLVWASKIYYNYLNSLLANKSTTNLKETIIEKPNAPSINIHPDIVVELHEILLPYFLPTSNNEKSNNDIRDSLMNALKGKDIKNKLLFNGNGINLIYAYRQLFDHNLILNSNKESLKQWIISSFQFRKGKEGIPTKFSEKTTYTILTTGAKSTKAPKNHIVLSSILNKE